MHEVESLRRAASAARASGPGNLSNVKLLSYTPAGSALAGLSCAGALNTHSGTREKRVTTDYIAGAPEYLISTANQCFNNNTPSVF